MSSLEVTESVEESTKRSDNPLFYIVLVGLLFILFHILSHFIGEWTSCSIQTLVIGKGSNPVGLFVVLFLVIWGILNEVYPKESWLQHVQWSLSLLVFTVLFLKGNVYFQLIAMVAIYIMYLRRKSMTEEEEKAQTWWWDYAVFGLIVISFVTYVGQKQREFGSSFSWERFFRPGVESCKGTVPMPQFRDFLTGIKKILMLPSYR